MYSYSLELDRPHRMTMSNGVITFTPMEESVVEMAVKATPIEEALGDKLLEMNRAHRKVGRGRPINPNSMTHRIARAAHEVLGNGPIARGLLSQQVAEKTQISAKKVGAFLYAVKGVERENGVWRLRQPIQLEMAT